MQSRPSVIPKGKLVAVDTEGTGLNPWTGAEIFAVSFCNDEGETGYMRWEVDPLTRKVHADKYDIEALQEFYADLSIRKLFHNAPYDLRMFERNGSLPEECIEKDFFDDTLFAVSLCHSLEINRGLKPLCKKYCGFDDIDEKDLHKSTVAGRREGKKKGWLLGDHVKADFWLADRDLCQDYAVKDAVRTMLLWQGCMKGWLTQRKAWKHYQRELDVFWVNWKMMGRGVRCSEKRLDSDIMKFLAQAHEHKQAVFDAVGYEFEMSKAAQLRVALFDKQKGLGLPVIERTAKTQQPSTSWKVLQKIDHPIVFHIAEHDSCMKAVTAMRLYKSLLVKDEKTGEMIIHPSFQQVQAITLRQSCRQPNLQNVANVETSLNKHTKSARAPYGPRKGFVWIAADYSKQEAGIFACSVHKKSGDSQLIDWIRDGKDPYAAAANLCWGKDAHYWRDLFKVSLKKAKHLIKKWNGDLVNAELSILKVKKSSSRTIAKSIWLGTLYGMGAATCATAMKRTIAEARKFLAQMHHAIPSMQLYSKILQEEAIADGYITTWFGRRIDVDRNFAYRCVNYETQGSAADQVKIGMLAVDKYLKYLHKKFGIEAYIVLTIHDEIMIEIRKKHLTKAVLRGIKRVLEAMLFSVKIKVDFERIDKQWDKKRKVKV